MTTQTEAQKLTDYETTFVQLLIDEMENDFDRLTGHPTHAFPNFFFTQEPLTGDRVVDATAHRKPTIEEMVNNTYLKWWCFVVDSSTGEGIAFHQRFVQKFDEVIFEKGEDCVGIPPQSRKRIVARVVSNLVKKELIELDEHIHEGDKFKSITLTEKGANFLANEFQIDSRKVMVQMNRWEYNFVHGWQYRKGQEHQSSRQFPNGTQALYLPATQAKEGGAR